MLSVAGLPFEVQVLIMAFILPNKYQLMDQLEDLTFLAIYPICWLDVYQAPQPDRECMYQNARNAARAAQAKIEVLINNFEVALVLESLYYSCPVMLPPLPYGVGPGRFWRLINWFHDLVDLVSCRLYLSWRLAACSVGCWGETVADHHSWLLGDMV